MSVTIKGDKEIITYLENKYGKSATKRITDFALTKGGQKVVQIIKTTLTPSKILENLLKKRKYLNL